MTQWISFQSTTHGPTHQQIFHWTFLHPNPIARTHYIATFRHILHVLDEELADKEWLVGGKCSAADLSFFSFQSRVGFIMGGDAPDFERELVHVGGWYGRMKGRGAVGKVLREHREVLRGLGF